MCDTANAMLSVVGLLAALYHRQRTGEGQELWTSLMDGGTVFASDVLLREDGTPSVRPKLDAEQRGFDAGYRLYETNDGWVQVAAIGDDHWSALCATLGVDASSDRRRAEAALEEAFRTRTAVMWSHALDDAGVPNEVARQVNGGEGLLFDADAERLGLVAEYEHPILGRLRQFGATIDFSDTPGHIRGPAPRVGEDTRAVLDELGYSGAEMDELKAAGVVTWPDESYPWGW